MTMRYDSGIGSRMGLDQLREILALKMSPCNAAVGPGLSLGEPKAKGTGTISQPRDDYFRLASSPDPL
jgi:hypothetical protein